MLRSVRIANRGEIAVRVIPFHQKIREHECSAKGQYSTKLVESRLLCQDKKG